MPAAERIGRHRGVEVRRWEDPSGARIVLGIQGRELHDLMPSLASAPGVRLGPLEPAGDETHIADLLDDDGETWTRAVVELEQRRLLPGGRHPGGAASLVALGRAITVHDDEDAFGASPESLLSPDADPPLRMAAESFIPVGAFAGEGPAGADAMLAAVVLGADRRVNAATGRAFVVARVRMIGAELDLCLAGDEFPEPPRPGQVVAGDVYLAASLAGDPEAGAAAPGRRFGFGRRRG